MKTVQVFIVIACLGLLAACNGDKKSQKEMEKEALVKNEPKTGYANVNGIKMYYEIHGKGDPLVLIHGGGSTIQTTFGRVLDSFAAHRQVIAVELQSHGHTEDKDRPFTFEQDADDVAALLKYLKIDSVDFFGFSNGGMTTLQIAIRHPQLVKKAAVASAIYNRSGMPAVFWEFMKGAKQEQMPQPLQEAYKQVAPNPDNLVKMHDKCAKRMAEFEDWGDKDLKAIKSPVLFISSESDVILPEHTLAMRKLVPNGNLIIFPGAHGEFIGEATAPPASPKIYAASVAIIEEFLDRGR